MPHLPFWNAERWRKILEIKRQEDELKKDIFKFRCNLGGSIVHKLGFSDEVVNVVEQFFENYDGGGGPLGLKGFHGPDEDPSTQIIGIEARIVRCAHVASIFYARNGRRDRRAARRAVQRQCGGVLDPEVVKAFFKAQAEPLFWDVLKEEETMMRFIRQQEEEADEPTTIDQAGIVQVAEGIAEYVESKTPYTSSHSRRVAFYAYCLAKKFRPGDEAFAIEVYIAALLHDVAKVGVPAGILYKPGPLSKEEWGVMERHPADGYAALAKIPMLLRAAIAARWHHRGINNTGYPRDLEGEQPLDAQFVSVADCFDAMLSNRPYRKVLMSLFTVLVNLFEDSGRLPRLPEYLKRPLPLLNPVVTATIICFDQVLTPWPPKRPMVITLNAAIVALIWECLNEWEEMMQASRGAVEAEYPPAPHRAALPASEGTAWEATTNERRTAT